MPNKILVLTLQNFVHIRLTSKLILHPFLRIFGIIRCLWRLRQGATSPSLSRFYYIS